MSVCFIACSAFLAPSPVAVVGLGNVESQVDFSFYDFSQLDFSFYDFSQLDISLLLADVPVLYTNTFRIQYTVYTLSGTVQKRADFFWSKEEPFGSSVCRTALAKLGMLVI